jgi:hypothetical protein
MSNDNDKKSKSASPDVAELFKKAHDEGTLSAGSLKSLDVIDLGAQIQAGLGVCVDDIASSEVVLVTMMPDDSGSIATAGNVAAVCEGHNLVLDALAASKQKHDIFVHTRYLNGHVLFPYVGVDHGVRMDRSNYTANLGTPLYDQAIVLLGTVLAKAQELADAGVAVRTVTLLITDGGDCGSTRAGARHVRELVADMRAAENHIVAAMGISDGSTDFRQVFRDMGIDDRWILTPRGSAAEVRKAFQMFSQSAVKASQSAAFPGLGGFTN